MTWLAVVLALIGAVAVAAGVALVFLPAGVIVAGMEALVAAYLIRYLGVRREVP